MIRTLPSLKLKQSPLVFVLAQVRFSAVLTMGEYFPQIQERLRKGGYPLNKSGTVNQVMIVPGSSPIVDQHPHWEVQTKDSTTSVVVAPDFVVVQTSAYDSFDAFVERLRTAVATVSEVVGGLLIQRTGVRYVDLIPPTDSWRTLIQPGLHGLTAGADLIREPLLLHQTMGSTTSGTILVRVHQNRSRQILPPDLVQNSLKLRFEAPSEGNLITLLDLDHFTEEQFDFDSTKLENMSWLLHDVLDQIFRNHVATPEALRKWS